MCRFRVFTDPLRAVILLLHRGKGKSVIWLQKCLLIGDWPGSRGATSARVLRFGAVGTGVGAIRPLGRVE